MKSMGARPAFAIIGIVLLWSVGFQSSHAVPTSDHTAPWPMREHNAQHTAAALSPALLPRR